jgi:hypothetical protein
MKAYKWLLAGVACMTLAGCGGGDDGVVASVDLNSQDPQSSGGMVFEQSGAEFVSDSRGWRIVASNGFMRFRFSGNHGFIFHAAGGRSGTTSCLVDVLVNGTLLWNDRMIDLEWVDYVIPASAFGSGENVVEIRPANRMNPYVSRASAGDGDGFSGDGAGGGGTNGGGGGSGQVWDLYNDRGDRARVLVRPFTNSGTFTETGDSPHWWLYDPSGNKVARVPVEGTIVHDSPYDRWSFQTMVSGGGISLTGRGEGTANGNYPGANRVDGRLTGTATSPLGAQQVSGTWYGVRR